jgi:CheY-like chemotaxis protein
VPDDDRVALSILIVDDHDDFRRSARSLLEAEGLVVRGEARDGAEAVELAARLRPDLVVLDIQLPDIDGFEVSERLAALPTPPIVVLISSRDAVAYGPRLASSPARGFVAKRDLSGERLLELAT